MSVINVKPKKKSSKKDEIVVLAGIAVILLLVIWLALPPFNKFLQFGYWGNNIEFFFAKLMGKGAAAEYLFHRNNAVYLVKMYPDRDVALKEMDLAIKTLPSYASTDELKSLYKDRAEIRFFMHDYNGALSDFVASDMITFNDNLKVALLYKLVGNYKQGLSYCNKILDRDAAAYAGFACLADIYSAAGRQDVALRVWNLAIDRNKNNPRAYVDRAKVRKALGDFDGYESDIKLAKEYLPTINVESSFIDETLNPRSLSLRVLKKR